MQRRSMITVRYSALHSQVAKRPGRQGACRRSNQQVALRSTPCPGAVPGSGRTPVQQRCAVELLRHRLPEHEERACTWCVLVHDEQSCFHSSGNGLTPHRRSRSDSSPPAMYHPLREFRQRTIVLHLRRGSMHVPPSGRWYLRSIVRHR